MSLRKWHRVLGLVMLLPLCGWAITGLVFFLKPGYEGAYELLHLKTYPLEQPFTLMPQPSWLEFRYLRTILGNHLLVRTTQGWQQLDPVTLTTRARPSEAEVGKLIQDALTANPNRYGTVVAINGAAITTDTDVRVTLDWNQLSVQQRGIDTNRIDGLYKVHYLQWTGSKRLDKVLGLIGLALLASLSVLGLMLAFDLKVKRTSNG